MLSASLGDDLVPSVVGVPIAFDGKGFALFTVFQWEFLALWVLSMVCSKWWMGTLTLLW